MHEEINKPIFVVGSPRSGTSILAWCLGHHPNLFPVPESSWMGDFAVSLAISHRVGAARGIFSVLSAMGVSRDEFFSHIGRSINSLILKHRSELDRTRLITAVQRHLKEKGVYLGEATGEFDAATSAALRQYGIAEDANDLLYSDLVASLQTPALQSGSKMRWVDQTPQYSFHICGLRKLFPGALFIHIVREVTSVVRSMLNFHRVAGTHLVANEEEAYRYWLRTVRACLKAEEAYGPGVVYRLRYPALVENPERALRSLLDFVGEPYSAKCLEPLSQRINSSNVPADFISEDPVTDPVIIEEAMRLSRELQHGSQPTEASVAATAEIEAAFDERVQYVAALDSQYRRALQTMQKLERTAALESDVLSNVAKSAKKPPGDTI
jgi:Sulfotransferase family